MLIELVLMDLRWPLPTLDLMLETLLLMLPRRSAFWRAGPVGDRTFLPASLGGEVGCATGGYDLLENGIFSADVLAVSI
jgi:hypothetical protein